MEKEKESEPAMTGAEILVDALKREKVDIVFGYPGGKVIPIFDVLKRSKGIDLLLTRHEQAATHAADGYARATGKVGVCIVTSGPGVTNTVTGIATAKSDSSPIVVISGQVATHEIGSDAFQEADMAGLARTVCKHNYLVGNVEELPQVLKNAFHIARSGRPGPVSVDVPVDVLAKVLAPYAYPDSPRLLGYHPRTKGSFFQIRKLADAVGKARKPLVLAGGGIIGAGAAAELAAFLEKTNIPAAVTMMGLGCLPPGHRLNLGMPGMHGTPAANYSLTECDLLIGLGTRFDDRVTSDTKSFASKAKIAHIDIDASEIGKNIRADLPIVGDVKGILAELTAKVAPRNADDWNRKTDEWKKQYPPSANGDGNGLIHPLAVIEALNTIAPPDTIFTTDVGQHQMWAAMHLNAGSPRSFISSGGMGTMGFGLPAAMGASLGNPGRPVINLSGDGGIQMCIHELATCSLNRIPVKIVVINNSCLGMVRQWQDLFWNKNYSKTCLKENPECGGACPEDGEACSRVYWPDLVKVAEANGMPGLRASRPSELLPVLEAGLAVKGPVLMEIVVRRDSNVFPMVSPGKPLNEIIFGRS
ncbi:MAG: biosynthetic-type acetolactate synthase large subunit [Candidatus Aminicenantales bacterium]